LWIQGVISLRRWCSGRIGRCKNLRRRALKIGLESSNICETACLRMTWCHWWSHGARPCRLTRCNWRSTIGFSKVKHLRIDQGLVILWKSGNLLHRASNSLQLAVLLWSSGLQSTSASWLGLWLGSS
jgi:hypothetical protein